MTSAITADELLLLYQDNIDRISELKSNQWKISHYGALVQAGIVSLALAKPELTKFSGTPILSLISIVAAYYAFVTIEQFQFTLIRRRDALVFLSQKPSGSFYEIRQTLRDQRKRGLYLTGENIWAGEWQFAVLFISFQILASAAALLVLH